MTRKEIINMLKEQDELVVSSSWVKDNDENVFDFLLEKLEGFAASKDNTAKDEDVKNFKDGKWLVEYDFDGDGVAYTAGVTIQDIANQPYWSDDEWGDINLYSLEAYLEKILKNEYKNEIVDFENLGGFFDNYDYLDNGLEDIFINQQISDLEIGKHNEQLNGNYVFYANNCDFSETTIYAEFETVGEWEVIPNEPGKLVKTIIDPESIKVKITNIEVA